MNFGGADTDIDDDTAVWHLSGMEMTLMSDSERKLDVIFASFWTKYTSANLVVTE
jgi:hypothetical protein